jgi:hypothetical protein
MASIVAAGQPRSAEEFMKTGSMAITNNDEIFRVFEDWLHGYLHAVSTEETRAACVNAVRAFADFIEPARLGESTVAEIKLFEQDAKANRRLNTRERRATLMAMGYFRSFRKQFLKPTGAGKISGQDARGRLARGEQRNVRRTCLESAALAEAFPPPNR